jgi:hypothetical protein
VQVIIAIEPRSYRQVVGQTIQALRAHIDVVVLEPATLGAGVKRLDPELVFANQPDTFAPTGRSAWVEFRPYEERPARMRICLGGRRWELEVVEFDDLLSLVDQTEELARTRRELGNC